MRSDKWGENDGKGQLIQPCLPTPPLGPQVPMQEFHLAQEDMD